MRTEKIACLPGGESAMLKFKARYKNGIIEPLEKVDIKDGTEITVALLEPKIIDPEGIIRSFGGVERYC
jgi:hypothetical protein